MKKRSGHKAVDLICRLPGLLTTAVLAVTAVGVLYQPAAAQVSQEALDSISTPDRVETSIGTLEFFDGIPTRETARRLYDNLDFLRGVETFLNGIPAASVEALRRGQDALGAGSSNQVVIFDQLMDSKPLFLTGNTDTVYASVFLDLQKDGPTVIEIPPKTGPGTVNDAYFRFVIDTGSAGPDKGEGGKYLIADPARIPR
jgi:hypothetical protein